MPLFQIDDAVPEVHASAFIAPTATLIGKVVIAERASVWFGAILRGDNEPIIIGAGSNVQDGVVMHTDPGFPLTLNGGVTIGHQAMLHGCTVGEGSLIGLQAVVLNGAVIGKQCLVGAGALVTERKHFPDRSLIIGAPAKVVRELTDEEVAGLKRSGETYDQRRAQYLTGLKALPHSR
jgi:carbonic anhydrase/acetyltransferase-like protein (isoleucine patch superfamily)